LRESAREKALEGVGPEGEVDSLMSREPSAGMDSRTSGS